MAVGSCDEKQVLLGAMALTALLADKLQSQRLLTAGPTPWQWVPGARWAAPSPMIWGETSLGY